MVASQRSVAEPEAQRELTLTRVFDVPARILFEAHALPEHVLQWFGPVGYPLDLCEMDFRVGGKYRFAMKGPDGKRMTTFGGEYLAIVDERRISYSNTMDLPGAETMVVTVTFAESGGKTTLTVHTLLASVAQKMQHLAMGYEAGVGSGFDQLAAVASRLAAP